MTIVNSTVLNIEKMLRVDFRCSHHTEKLTQGMIAVIISLCIDISNHPIVHLKYIRFLLKMYLKKKKEYRFIEVK